ncbi:MAG TPA: adenosylcobinamide-phosphate synthase CbiB [Allocoleopsis sp.]
MIILLSVILDYLIGDPQNLLHPVQVMGWFINFFTQFFLNLTQNSLLRRLAGIFITIILVIGSGLMGWLIVKLAYHIHYICGIVIETIMLASCFALKSLTDAAKDVLNTLVNDDLNQARITLSKYVGRDTDQLSSTDILRAVLETVSENATDGVMSPLFYAILGAFIPAVGSVPLALAYKASSTLDSMIGYKQEPFIYLGWCSAKLEDLLTWFPCRLTVISLGLISGKIKTVWRLCQRDANQDPSPNSGWSECTYAAILGVQLGGINWYKGVQKPKPLLGDKINVITPEVINKSLQLTNYAFLLWVMITVVIFQLY